MIPYLQVITVRSVTPGVVMCSTSLRWRGKITVSRMVNTPTTCLSVGGCRKMSAPTLTPAVRWWLPARWTEAATRSEVRNYQKSLHVPPQLSSIKLRLPSSCRNGKPGSELRGRPAHPELHRWRDMSQDLPEVHRDLLFLSPWQESRECLSEAAESKNVSVRFLPII